MEKWKPIDCVEGMYEVSSEGRVRSVERTILQSNGKLRTFPGKIKSPSNNGYGYLGVSMFMRSKCIRRYVHRLVAEAFIDNHGNLPQVNHKDGDKENNCISNLEWCSASDNCKHAISSGLYEMARGERAGNAKLKEFEVKEIRALASQGVMQKDIAERYGVGRKAITKIVNRQRWTHI